VTDRRDGGLFTLVAAKPHTATHVGKASISSMGSSSNARPVRPRANKELRHGSCFCAVVERIKHPPGFTSEVGFGYEHRIATLQWRPDAPTVVLPFVPARAQRMAAATCRFEDLIVHRGASAPGAIVPPRTAIPAPAPVSVRSVSLPTDRVPTLIEPIRAATRPAPRLRPMLVAAIRPA
jgi:hypothetical protein